MRMETIWQLSVHGPGVESTVRFCSNIFISMVKTPIDFFWGMLITVTFKLHSALLILYLLKNIFIKALTLTQTQSTASKTSKAPFAGSMRPLASRVNFSERLNKKKSWPLCLSYQRSRMLWLSRLDQVNPAAQTWSVYMEKRWPVWEGDPCS